MRFNFFASCLAYQSRHITNTTNQSFLPVWPGRPLLWNISRKSGQRIPGWAEIRSCICTGVTSRGTTPSGAIGLPTLSTSITGRFVLSVTNSSSAMPSALRFRKVVSRPTRPRNPLRGSAVVRLNRRSRIFSTNNHCCPV